MADPHAALLEEMGQTLDALVTSVEALRGEVNALRTEVQAVQPAEGAGGPRPRSIEERAQRGLPI